jgi:Kelch motif
VHAILSETPTPEGPEFLKHIEQARITAGGKVLNWTKAEDTFRVSLPEASPDAVDGFCDLGIKKRDGVSFSLRTHHYDENTTTRHFRRLNLKDRSAWQELTCGPALQGVVLVAHHDCLYRIGGMAAHNRPGQPNDLESIAEFARFDPRAKLWTALPPMPSPRSTHDAVVVGGKIYVFGGWRLAGGGSENAEFLDTALMFDLNQKDGRWESLPTPPFRRRALAAASIKGRLTHRLLPGISDDLLAVGGNHARWPISLIESIPLASSGRGAR